MEVPQRYQTSPASNHDSYARICNNFPWKKADKYNMQFFALNFGTTVLIQSKRMISFKNIRTFFALYLLNSDLAYAESDYGGPDYGGRELVAAHTSSSPYIRKFNRGNDDVLVGSDVQMIRYIEKALNFRAK